MPKIKINNKEIEFEQGMTVLQACELAGAEIPRFCYHERLSIAGNCRMCLVEMERSLKPIASCAMPAGDGMVIKTNTPLVDKARKGVMEFLLANHPLDCPVCDQGGECDLQDQSMFYGFDQSRFVENKREVKEKNMGPLIKTQMTRCIHCTRCIRFATEVAGVDELGAIGRGEDMQVTTYLEKSMNSELSANVIDLCPVGALTSKPYVFEARPWELKKTETIDVMDAVGSNIRVDTYGWEVKRILPRINESINEEWISDKTRYACDGLLKQRLDIPYVRENGNLKKTTWENAYKIISKKIKSHKKENIAGLVGDLVDLETMFAFKMLFKHSIGSQNIEFRSKKIYINPSERINYIFNSSINGIEESDLIVLVGTNPRLEASIINARIRKSFLKNKIKILSIGNPGNLSYPYEYLGSDVSVIQKIISNNHELSSDIKKSKRPLFIIGQSALIEKKGEYIFESIKNYLCKNNFINEKWNALNVLNQNASHVGALDLGMYSIDEKNNYVFFDKLKNNNFKVLYLLGFDEVLIDKKEDQFVIYQGSHGDKGAEVADVILPGAAYTEKNGLFVNAEGKLQKAYKATYPPGNAKEDWVILKKLSEKLKKPLNFKSQLEIVNQIFKETNCYSEKDNSSFINVNETKTKEVQFQEGLINIEKIDYYLSNVIARSSKIMNECQKERQKFLFTGTDG